MRSPYYIIGLLVAAAALVDLCLWTAVHRSNKWHDWPELLHALYVAFIFAQASLAATWIGIGPGKWIVRLGAGVIVLAAIWLIAPHDSDGIDFALAFGEQLFIVWLPLLGLQLAGYHLTCEYERFDTSSNGSRRPAQFSLANLLQLTTVVAVVAALAMRLELHPDALFVITWFAFASAVPVPFVLMATLTVGNRWPWIVVSIGLAFGAVASFWLWWSLGPARVLYLFCLAQYFLVVIAFLVVRIAGYRVIRSPRFSFKAASAEIAGQPK